MDDAVAKHVAIVRRNEPPILPDPARLPEYAFIHHFEKGYLAWPYKQAVIGTGESYTYAEIYLRCKALTWYLQKEQGIGPQSIVAVASSNVIDLPVIMGAVQACGAMLVLCSGTAEPSEYVAYAKQVKPDLFIVNRSDAVKELAQCFPGLIIMTLRCKSKGAKPIEWAISEFRDQGIAYIPQLNSDPRIVLFSSGSTGSPKAIVNRTSSFYHNACEIARSYRVTADDVLYLPVPFFHSYGMIGLNTGFSTGATVVTLLKYRPESSLWAIESSRATVYFGVPTMYLREMRVNDDDEWDLSSLRVAKLAGAPCPEAAVAEYEERYGCRMLPSYGMTETAATLTVTDYDAPLSVRASSVGVPIEGVSIKLDPLTGELLCKSTSMMDGVLQEDGTLKLDLDEDGWFHSGDIAKQDEEGNYYIVGRIKDIVIRGGVNIFPAEVENIYQTHKGIAESCLVGYPDPELGERTCLCVTEKEGFNEPAALLRAYAIGKLEKCKIPDIVMKINPFPRLPNGKTDKKALRHYVQSELEKTKR